MMSVSSVALTSPPMTTMASGFWISEPGPLAKSSGTRPKAAMLAVISTGRRRRFAPSTTISATYSPAILGPLLRDTLGFTGVVLTDDLGMAGALSQGDLPDCCVEAFAAGCDQLLVCEHHDRHDACAAALAAALAKSPALARRADESRARIRRTFG